MNGRNIHLLSIGAVVGGLLMLIKGSVILLIGIQPPYIFEIAPLFLGIGLWGLYLCLPPTARGRLAQAGLVFAIATAVSAPIHLWAELFAPQFIPQEDTVTIITPFVVLGGIGAMVSAFLLGILIWRNRAISPAWLPLAIPLGFIFLMILFIIAEEALGETAVVERLLEIPIVILGIGWVWLGLIIYNTLNKQSSHHQSTLNL
jgi:hypothetical protein